MKTMPKSDLLYIRTLIAESGDEMTPQELIDLFKEVNPGIEFTNEPGLIDFIREMREMNDNRD